MSHRFTGNRTSVVAAAVVILLVALATVFWGKLTREPAAPRFREPVSLCFSWTIGLLPGVARAEDYFADEGVTVNLKPYSSGRDALEAMLAGRCDLATVAETPIVLKSFERRDFRIITATRVLGIHNKIVARRDHGIAEPADFKGKRIGVLRATAAHFFLYRFLLEQGLTTQDVSVVFGNGIPALRRALAEGTIDALALWEPHVGRVQSALGSTAQVFEAPGLVINTANLVATERLVQQRPQVIPPLLRGVLRAQVLASAEPRRAMASLARLVDESRDEVAANWTGELALSINQSYLLSLEEEARWALRSGLVGPEKVVPNYLDLLYLEGLEQVAPGAVTVLH